MRSPRLLAAAAAALSALACGGGGSSPPPAPPTVSSFEGNGQSANQGTAVAVAPAVRLVDASGNPVAGASVTFEVRSGGGTITAPASATPRTSLSVASGTDGVARIGSWIMGPAGAQVLQAAASATGSPVTFTASSLAEVPAVAAAMEAASLTPQRAQAGTAVGDPPAVLVVDSLGRPVPSTAVDFAVTAGGGSLTGASTSTGADGVARVGSWVLGPAGAQQVQAAVPGLAGSPVTFDAAIRSSAYDITLQFVSAATLSQRLAFQRARERIEEVVVGDVPGIRVTLTSTEMLGCGGGGAIDQVVDDLLVRVNLGPIDGPGKVLGQAGPCVVRTDSDLPVLGVMQFDTADLDTLETRGQLDEVILHEMLHVVGFGTIWDMKSPAVLVGAGTSDPTFTGVHAMDAFLAFDNGSFYAGAKIPVENSGGSGTADSHWRETVFKNELMTGFLSGATQPLSRTTAGSLQDLGYQVDLSAADPFDLSTAALRAAPALPEPAPLELVDDVLRLPLRTVDPDGTIRWR